jgi:5-formaminoimidazole-4-carboxamide-1-(beta)-D-ribofuranosyl 5'-monophosphate synthetase
MMPISKDEVEEVVRRYDFKNISIGVIGSHSAEEVGSAAKAFGFRTVVVCQKGREDLYAYYNKHLFDEVIVLERFSDIVDESVQERLRSLNTIFLPNRSLTVYVGYKNLEEKFLVPMYGNRFMLKTEERRLERNQYWLLERAGVRTPKRFSSPEEIDRLVIVKVAQKAKPLERAFFTAKNVEEYWVKAEDLAKRGVISLEDLKNAVIEEFVLGPRYNANFQAWALKDVFGKFDFLGFDDRRQVNLSGILNLTAREQLELDVPIKNEEIGHYGLTMRESQKPLVYRAAENFVKVCCEEYPPGLIGPFALQGAIAYDPEDPEGRRLEFFVFDVSPRIPGSPCVGPTSPEMRRLYLKYHRMLDELGIGLHAFESVLDFSMLEICYAISKGRLTDIVT